MVMSIVASLARTPMVSPIAHPWSSTVAWSRMTSVGALRGAAGRQARTG